MGLSFLKKAASTLTRLIRRLTAISSRSMSWPKTSTRPLSSVSSPLMRRMRVDLPEPFAPRIPWMSPRSRRIDRFEIAATGLRLRPTTNDLLTPSRSSAGTAEVAVEATGAVAGGRLQLVGQDGGHWWLQVRGRGGHRTSRGPRPTLRRVGLAARDAGPGSAARSAGRAVESIKKAGGPIWPTARALPEGGPAACG